MPREEKPQPAVASLDTYLHSRTDELRKFELDLEKQKEAYTKERTAVEQDIQQLQKTAGKLIQTISGHFGDLSGAENSWKAVPFDSTLSAPNASLPKGVDIVRFIF